MRIETPEENLRQVMAWYPNKKFYKRHSAKSGENIISVYSPQSPCPVYSHDEWYAEDWTPPFFQSSGKCGILSGRGRPSELLH